MAGKKKPIQVYAIYQKEKDRSDEANLMRFLVSCPFINTQENNPPPSILRIRAFPIRTHKRVRAVIIRLTRRPTTMSFPLTRRRRRRRRCRRPRPRPRRRRRRFLRARRQRSSRFRACG